MNKIEKLRELVINHYIELINIPDDLLLLALSKLPRDKSLITKYGSSDYNRLEFLGDAVLDLIVADVLFHNFSITTSKELSIMRSKMVQNISLTCLSEHKGLCDLIIPYRHGDKDCADVFEALIGAIYYYLKPTYNNPLEFILYWLNKEFNFSAIIDYLLINIDDNVCNATNLNFNQLYEYNPVYKILYQEGKQQNDYIKQQIATLINEERKTLETLYEQKRKDFNIDVLENKVNSMINKELTKLENLTQNELLLQQRSVQQQLAKTREISSKTKLENFYVKNKLSKPIKYVTSKIKSEYHTSIICPSNLNCDLNYIGVGIDFDKKQSEEKAAKEALSYLEQFLYKS